MGWLPQIPLRLLPDTMQVRVALGCGKYDEAVTVEHVRFVRTQEKCDDEHRDADAGSGRVYIDAVNSPGAFEILPGYANRAQMASVEFAPDMAGFSFINMDYWFYGLSAVTTFVGIANLVGVREMQYTFASCSRVASLDFRGFDPSHLTNLYMAFGGCSNLVTIYADSTWQLPSSGVSGTQTFYNCPRLVGGTDGFVPNNTAAASVCKLGSGGVLTNPVADIREWCKVHVYSDGSVVFTKAGAVDPGKTLLASGRLCVSAYYKASGLIPGYAYRAQMANVTFAADMAQFSYVNMNYWFYGLGAITFFAGIANLANVHEMQYAFNSCTGITELDFRRFDPSHLTNLYLAFGSGSNLVTIYADPTWALPTSGVSGSQTFYNCNALVGGNGTTYTSSRTGYSYFRIDREGRVGYLTA